MKRVGPVTEVTKSRDISDTTRWLLWGRAAGRCQFFGCNEPLWKSPVTQEQVNIAEAAHIYAFSVDGPRGHDGIDLEKLNDIENLMLACHGCHKTMDKDKEGTRYSVELLQSWKAAHEARIEIVTGVVPKNNSHVVLYGANIGRHGSPLSFNEAASALFPLFFPAEGRPIVLGMTNNAHRERDHGYWQVESENLRTQYDRKVKQRIEAGEINHLSVFGLAPQPLLILLGTLMIDITPAEVYQRHREPQSTWTWPEEAKDLKFEVVPPRSGNGPPALALALSAPIVDERILTILGKDAAIWRVTVSNPNNDLIKSRAHLSAFRMQMRDLLERIKVQHGENTPLHIFPAAGVSTAIEFGRVRMPKATLPWRIYDQIDEQRGFVEALTISDAAAV